MNRLHEEVIEDELARSIVLQRKHYISMLGTNSMDTVGIGVKTLEECINDMFEAHAFTMREVLGIKTESQRIILSEIIFRTMTQFLYVNHNEADKDENN